MFGTGFNHFWHADARGHGGDLLYIQGHSSPGSTPGPTWRGGSRRTSC
jgi:pyruvate dehydrogenase complex dehydrogenase (E1) component